MAEGTKILSKTPVVERGNAFSGKQEAKLSRSISPSNLKQGDHEGVTTSISEDIHKSLTRAQTKAIREVNDAINDLHSQSDSGAQDLLAQKILVLKDEFAEFREEPVRSLADAQRLVETLSASILEGGKQGIEETVKRDLNGAVVQKLLG